MVGPDLFMLQIKIKKIKFKKNLGENTKTCVKSLNIVLLHVPVLLFKVLEYPSPLYWHFPVLSNPTPTPNNCDIDLQVKRNKSVQTLKKSTYADQSTM